MERHDKKLELPKQKGFAINCFIQKLFPSKKKSKIRRFFGYAYAAVTSFLIVSFDFLVIPAYADNNTLQSVINLLKGGVCCIGGACTIWGIVQLGLGLKDGSGGGGQLNGAIAFIIGGAAIFGGGMLLGTLDTSWVTG